jgi:plastocyanin
MTRIRLLSALALAFAVGGAATAQDKKWATIKGQIVFPAGKEAPKPAEINVTADKEHCLSKGALASEELVVNPKNKGVKNVWVYLKPAEGDTFDAAAVHPDLAKPAAKEHVIDQPVCAFVPRVVVARAGDTLLVKNSSPVPHNIKFAADNLEFNQTLAAGGSYKPEKALEAQRNPATFACNVHPWMGGRVVIFDHPYFALTDADGNFEIKNAPQGKFRIFYRHELGYHKGRDGAKGFPVEIAGDKVEMKPVEIELPVAK